MTSETHKRFSPSFFLPVLQVPPETLAADFHSIPWNHIFLDPPTLTAIERANCSELLLGSCDIEMSSLHFPYCISILRDTIARNTHIWRTKYISTNQERCVFVFGYSRQNLPEIGNWFPDCDSLLWLPGARGRDNFLSSLYSFQL